MKQLVAKPAPETMVKLPELGLLETRDLVAIACAQLADDPLDGFGDGSLVAVVSRHLSSIDNTTRE
jgi:hypothetical protein